MVQQLPSGENISPLVVVRTSSGMDLVNPGSTLQLGITIHNQGQNSAIIYTYIEERSSILRQWCPSMQERLALGPNQSGEVVFKIRVPADALPEILEYDLVVDASDYYPGFPPLRYDQQQLQVLAAERTSVQTNDPVFYIDPQSSSQKPVSAQPNIGLPIQVWVENRSDRVDRFRLSCAGLPPDWETTITYPQDNQGLGLIVAADSMGLNPGARGQILLLLKPPANALAGSYVPTLRLSSQNDPTLNLLDLVYLQVEPVYQLLPTLQTLRSVVRNQSGLFEVQLDNNLGNTSRKVKVKVQSLNQPKHCLYTLEEEQITVSPHTKQPITLKGEPQKWWRRPLYGSGRTYNFRVEVEDPENHPLLANELRGSLTWAARPWWQLLLLVLAALGVLGTLAWLIWWYILRPPATPAILDFAIEDARYAEVTGDVARVGWQIEHPERIKTLRVTGYSADGKILSGPITYDFTDKDIPPGLAANCNQQETILTCSNVRTDARKPGEYTFELTLISKNRRQKKPISEQSDVVVIAPKPLPIVAEFFAPDVLYQEAGAASLLKDDDPADEIPAIDGAGIRLNWRVTQVAELQAFKLIGRTADGKMMGEINYQLEQRPEGLFLPDELTNFCEFTETEIVCEDVPTEVFQAGTYQFELQTLTQGQPSEAEPILTELITIEPQAPQILAFLINGDVAQPKHVYEITTGVSAPTLSIDWDVRGGETTSVSLLPVPGNVPSQGTITFPLKPESGSTTITLQAQNAAGKSITQSVVVETYDPDVTPAKVAAAAAAAAAEASAEAMQANGEAGASLLPEGVMPDALEQRDPVETERLSPSELPPRFN